MASVKHPCKNHPDKFTARKCYYCKDPVCLDCQKSYFHHIFCSLKCAVKWRILDLLSIFKTSRELGWFVTIVVLSNIIMYSLLVNRFEKQEKHNVIVDDSTTVYPAPAGFGIDSLRHAIQGKFKIDVQADPGMVITLAHNGKFVESLLAGENGFSFDNVVLKNGNNTFSIWGLNKLGKSILIDSFSIVYKAPRLEYLMHPVYRVKSDKKILAFTFDGGASDKGTEKILDILRRQKIKCTMFLTGEFIKHYPDLVKKMIEDGHEIGNHSYNHPHFTDLEINGKNTTRPRVDRAFLQHQLNETDSLFYQIFKKRLKPFWRAPYGEINRQILFWAAELGYRHIGWSYHCDSWDWVADKRSKLYRSAKEIENHFLTMDEKSGLNGKIILMHLGSERENDFPYTTLSDLITKLKKRGYVFKQVSELLKG